MASVSRLRNMENNQRIYWKTVQDLIYDGSYFLLRAGFCNVLRCFSPVTRVILKRVQMKNILKKQTNLEDRIAPTLDFLSLLPLFDVN